MVEESTAVAIIIMLKRSLLLLPVGCRVCAGMILPPSHGSVSSSDTLYTSNDRGRSKKVQGTCGVDFPFVLQEKKKRGVCM